MRILGLETEYGITDPTDLRANPILLSSLLVTGLAVLGCARGTDGLRA